MTGLILKCRNPHLRIAAHLKPTWPNVSETWRELHNHYHHWLISVMVSQSVSQSVSGWRTRQRQDPSTFELNWMKSEWINQPQNTFGHEIKTEPLTSSASKLVWPHLFGINAGIRPWITKLWQLIDCCILSVIHLCQHWEIHFQDWGVGPNQKKQPAMMMWW